MTPNEHTRTAENLFWLNGKAGVQRMGETLIGLTGKVDGKQTIYKVAER
jgi:hypothetical protein